MININPADFLPSPKNWFTPKIEYQGFGVAVFENPRGRLEGSATATFEESGESRITLQIERLVLEDQDGGISFSEFNLDAFLAGLDVNRITAKPFARGLPGATRNPCTSFHIRTLDGTFSVHTQTIQYQQIGLFENRLEFYPMQSQFDLQVDDEKYFVMPLINYLPHDLTPAHPVLLRHPLRLVTVPEIPDNLEGDDQTVALVNANSKWIIGFLFDKKPAFIEPLLDYETHKDSLLGGKSQSLITSIMVGDIEGKPGQTHQN